MIEACDALNLTEWLRDQGKLREQITVSRFVGLNRKNAMPDSGSTPQRHEFMILAELTPSPIAEQRVPGGVMLAGQYSIITWTPLLGTSGKAQNEMDAQRADKILWKNQWYRVVTIPTTFRIAGAATVWIATIQLLSQ